MAIRTARNSLMNLWMTRCLTVMLMLLSAALPAASHSVQFTVSKAHCVLYLVESLRGEPHHTPHLRHLFMDRRGIKDQDQRLIEEYQSLLSSMEGKIQVRADGDRTQSTSDLLEIMAVNAPSVEEFLRQSRVLLPAQEHRRLRAVMHHFEPLYDELFWKESRKEIEEQIESLKAEAQKVGLNEVITLTSSLLESTWPDDETFMVAFVPVARKENEHITTFAHSLGFLQVIEAPQRARLSHGLGIIVHEICHALWFSRDNSKKEQFRQWFEEERGNLAYQELNEALATALGNGWAAHLEGEKGRREQWYNDDYTDRFSKAVYGLLQDYRRTGKPLDRRFAHEAVLIFRKCLPRAENDIRLLMRELVVISGDGQVQREEFRLHMSRLLPIHSLHSAVPLESEKSAATFSMHHTVTALFMMTPGEIKALHAYGFDCAFLERLKKDSSRGAPLLRSLQLPGRRIYFCIADTFENQQKLLDSLFDRKESSQRRRGIFPSM